LRRERPGSKADFRPAGRAGRCGEMVGAKGAGGEIHHEPFFAGKSAGDGLLVLGRQQVVHFVKSFQ